MAVRSKEDIMKDLADFAEESASDKILSILEDVSDSLVPISEEQDVQELVRTAVEEKEAEWRERYLNRFRGLSEEQVTVPVSTPKEDEIRETEVIIEGNDDEDVFETRA